MKSIHWEVVRDSLLLFGILTFSLPLKTPAIQSFLESILQISFPIQLSTYTLFLPMWLGITVLIHLLRIPEVWRQLKIPLLLMVMLFVWMWVGTWFSEWRGHSLKHAGRYTIHFLVFLTLLLLVNHQNIRSMTAVLLGWFSVVSGLTVAEQLFADWQLQSWFTSIGLGLELHAYESTSGLSSLFENQNPYGIVSVGLLGISLFGVVQKQWFLGIAGAFASIWGIVLSGSRNAALILIIYALLIIFVQFGRAASRHKHYWKIFIGISVLLIGVTVITSVFNPRVLMKSQQTWEELQTVREFTQLEKIDPRFWLYRMAVEYGLQHPSLFGVGVKSFGYAVSEGVLGPMAAVIQNANETWNAHNALLTIWIEMGWVGLFLALGFLTSWFWKCRRASFWLMASVLTLCLGQILDYFIWQITFMTVQSLVFVMVAASSNYGLIQEQ
jgi:O-antigen ligase